MNEPYSGVAVIEFLFYLVQLILLYSVIVLLILSDFYST